MQKEQPTYSPTSKCPRLSLKRFARSRVEGCHQRGDEAACCCLENINNFQLAVGWAESFKKLGRLVAWVSSIM